jgi:hypothetical protein
VEEEDHCALDEVVKVVNPLLKPSQGGCHKTRRAEGGEKGE